MIIIIIIITKISKI